MKHTITIEEDYSYIYDDTRLYLKIDGEAKSSFPNTKEGLESARKAYQYAIGQSSAPKTAKILFKEEVETNESK